MYCKSNATFSLKWWTMNIQLTTSITISSAMIHPVLPSICFPVTQSYINFTPWQQTTAQWLTSHMSTVKLYWRQTTKNVHVTNKFMSLKNNSFWVILTRSVLESSWTEGITLFQPVPAKDKHRATLLHRTKYRIWPNNYGTWQKNSDKNWMFLPITTADDVLVC